MRTIKFKAWDKENRKILVVVTLNWSEELVCLSDAQWLPFEAVELMQYTGLKDKNGKEIYEGDILEQRYRLFSSDEEVVVNRIVVKFENGEFTDGKTPTRYALKTRLPYVVIGNIYENPELIK